MRINADPGKRRRVFAVGLVGFCAFLSLYSTQPLLPLFHRIFHASKLAVSLTVSSATLAVALAAPFVGMVYLLLGSLIDGTHGQKGLSPLRQTVISLKLLSEYV